MSATITLWLAQCNVHYGVNSTKIEEIFLVYSKTTIWLIKEVAA